MRFSNRQEAGKLLAETLSTWTDGQAVVYALPRGGIVLGVEVARYLHAPLDLIIPRKVGHPHHADYAVAAVTEDGHLVCNQTEITRLDAEWLKNAIKKEQSEAQRLRLRYVGNGPELSAQNRIAIIVDDGIATGLTMLAAIQEAKDRLPSQIIIAVPIAPREVIRQLENYVDAVVVLVVPETFLGSISAYYEEFNAVSDEHVLSLLSATETNSYHRGGYDTHKR